MPTPHLISFAGTEPEDLGIGHRIEVSALTGASVVHLPLEFTRGRGDFTPRLTLEYTSSAENSPFGLGWSLGGLLAVNIDTRKALPRYDGHDRFAFSGSGELVPVFRDGAAGWQQRVEERDEFWVRYFRERVEGGHIRIEQWSEKATGRVYWRTRDARNVVTVYGFDASDAARIADHADAARTFAWMPEAQYDASGNAIKFEYVPEDRKGLDTSVAYERRGHSPDSASATSSVYSTATPSHCGRTRRSPKTTGGASRLSSTTASTMRCPRPNLKAAARGLCAPTPSRPTGPGLRFAPIACVAVCSSFIALKSWGRPPCSSARTVWSTTCELKAARSRPYTTPAFAGKPARG